MAYDEWLAERLRKALEEHKTTFIEKKMMGGLCFMVDDKMCVGIVKDHLMARIGPVAYDAALEKPGCRKMDFTGRPMKGYVFVDPEALDSDQDLNYWVKLGLDFNPLAKSSKNKNKTKAN